MIEEIVYVGGDNHAIKSPYEVSKIVFKLRNSKKPMKKLFIKIAEEVNEA
ncbi:MAG: hypothetical protein ACLTS6_08665 [Anaerobutyricum sp.]